MSPTRFHLSVKLIACNANGEYLVLRRSQSSKHFRGQWELPGGKVDPGEDFDAALLREVREETGLSAVLERAAGSESVSLDEKQIVYVFMEGHYEVGDVRLSSEHDEFRWIPIGQLLALGDAWCPQFRSFVTAFCRSRGSGRSPPVAPAPSHGQRLAELDEHIRGFCEVRPRFVSLADELTKILRKEAARSCPLALIDARAKSVSSFAEKILRKGKYTDPLREITDLCGIRVVAHLKSEVEAMCAFIRDNFRVDEKNSLDTLSRLQPAEFGYRSVHYVVQLRPDRFPDIEADLCDLTAEIQVRTILQHAWSDIGHDRIYKGSFRVPAEWARESARIAAVLEGADESFSRMVNALDAYRSDYGAYLAADELAREQSTTEIVRQHDPANVALVERAARLALAAGAWDTARVVAESFRGLRTPGLDTCLGTALCRLHLDDRAGAGFARGLERLRSVAAEHPADTESRLRLAEFEALPAERLQLFAAAFAADPSDPETLASYVREKVLVERDASFVSLLRPSFETAIEKCRLQVAAGVDVPRAFLRSARFNLLLGREWGAVDALAHAIRCEGNTAVVASLVERALEETDALGALHPTRNDVASFARLLSLARHLLHRSEASTSRLRALATPGVATIPGPVTIVAGGCDPSVRDRMESYLPLLERAFASYRGTLISGGTVEGISGLVGALGAASGGRIHTLGYVPARFSAADSAHEDRRYAELRKTAGTTGFSALEPLQNWIDLFASGIEPHQVRLLGVNGGRIAALEFRIAWALGAHVAIVRGSGREADRLEREIESHALPGVLVLPRDPMTLRAFLHGGRSGDVAINASQQERLARYVHADFLEANRHAHPDHAMRPWELLDDGMRNSNLDHVAYMTQILRTAGFDVVPRSSVRSTADITPRIECMAEMEHGRWNVERLRSGWRLGARDPARKQSPYLVAWDQLPEDVRQWDRENVARFPELLARVGLNIVAADENPAGAPPRS